MIVGGILNLGPPPPSYMGRTLAFLFPCDLSEEQAQILPSGIIHRSNLGWTLLAIIHYSLLLCHTKKNSPSLLLIYTYTYTYKNGEAISLSYSIPLFFKFCWITRSVTAPNTNLIDCVSVAHVR